MRRVITSIALAALVPPRDLWTAPAPFRRRRPPVEQRWEHIATYHEEALCAATGHSGVRNGDWIDYDCVFNEEYGAWDLHVRLPPP
ncbi:hypothetical protein [Saccharothrix coeruleofusca]|uniref:Uncharacterized protein n=1 Tax=Saccharothrix coeruleofusca TaxID=33919 RepID=A0A918AVX4_9PSEU|nr:hypothetical protein [Saccharothrix coeruleofusca]MBP2336759.1 hypothetical protein [Saccharothrix coeruleofusca]GGP78243.1 hypothetical protein GCM10010185_59970 [Saccharothrix coeruleofusca]